MKNIKDFITESIISEAKVKTAPLGELYHFFIGNYKNVGDKYKGNSVDFGYWGQGIRSGGSVKKQTIEDFKKLTGLSKFEEHIPDNFLADIMGFKTNGNKSLSYRAFPKIGAGDTINEEVSDMCKKYIAAAIQEIEIPVSESGRKKFFNSGEFENLVCDKLKELGINFGNYTTKNKIKGKILISAVADDPTKKSDQFRAIHITIDFRPKDMNRVYVPLTFRINTNE